MLMGTDLLVPLHWLPNERATLSGSVLQPQYSVGESLKQLLV